MADMFSESSDKSDIVLIVEDKPVHVNKSILALASPVFDAMFKADFKEKRDSEIPLPGKKYEDFIEFLLCFYPHSMKPVTYDNLDAVLPLADEYQVENIKRLTDEAMERRSEQKPLSNTMLVHIILMADKYGLAKTREKTIKIAMSVLYENLTREGEFARVSDTAKKDILLGELKLTRDALQYKVTSFETGWRDLTNCQNCPYCIKSNQRIVTILNSVK